MRQILKAKHIRSRRVCGSFTEIGDRLFITDDGGGDPYICRVEMKPDADGWILVRARGCHATHYLLHLGMGVIANIEDESGCIIEHGLPEGRYYASGTLRIGEQQSILF